MKMLLQWDRSSETMGSRFLQVFTTVFMSWRLVLRPRLAGWSPALIWAASCSSMICCAAWGEIISKSLLSTFFVSSIQYHDHTYLTQTLNFYGEHKVADLKQQPNGKCFSCLQWRTFLFTVSILCSQACSTVCFKRSGPDRMPAALNLVNILSTHLNKWMLLAKFPP